MPKINPWTCYGGGLLAGLLAYVIFDGNFWATIGGTVAWITFYTFSLAMRQGDNGGEGDAERRPGDAEELPRQQRRAAARRESKDR